MIVTGLNLDPAAPDHDAKALSDVIQTVANAAIAANSGYHVLVVRNA